jgi:hypothetical protein
MSINVSNGKRINKINERTKFFIGAKSTKKINTLINRYDAKEYTQLFNKAWANLAASREIMDDLISEMKKRGVRKDDPVFELTEKVYAKFVGVDSDRESMWTLGNVLSQIVQETEGI